MAVATGNNEDMILQDIIHKIDEYSEGTSVLTEILKAQDWLCAYYSGYGKKSLIRLLSGSPLKHLNVYSRVSQATTHTEDPRSSKDEDWRQKVHYWKTGGMLDNEIFITDYPWQRDGELKDTLRESTPQIVFLFNEAATQTEQKRYSWRKGKDFLVGQLKSIYAHSANTGERFKLLLGE